MAGSSGVVPVHAGATSSTPDLLDDAVTRAAYASSGLHGVRSIRATVQPSGRYAMPVKPYVWRDPARFQKRMAVERALGQGA